MTALVVEVKDIHSFIMGCVGGRFMIAMGSLQTVAQYDDRDLALYQCILLKAKATPFGVPFYGTRLLVSYEAIVKVTSVIASIFFFMVSSGIAGRKN